MNLLLNIRAKYCFLRANGIYYNYQQKGVDRMAGNTTNISIRMDADLKAQADALFTELGMNLTTAFNLSLIHISEDRSEFIASFDEYDLLIIDDLGVELSLIHI